MCIYLLILIVFNKWLLLLFSLFIIYQVTNLNFRSHIKDAAVREIAKTPTFTKSKLTEFIPYKQLTVFVSL